MVQLFKVRDTLFGEIFYGTSDLETLIPKGLPYKFRKNPGQWKEIATQWFETGIKKDSVLIPVNGIIKENAIKHIQCIFNTWFLTREQKVMNAAFLLSQWFTSITL